MLSSVSSFCGSAFSFMWDDVHELRGQTPIGKYPQTSSTKDQDRSY